MIKTLIRTGMVIVALYIIAFKIGIIWPGGVQGYLQFYLLLGVLGLIFVLRIPSKRQKHNKRKNFLFESYEED